MIEPLLWMMAGAIGFLVLWLVLEAVEREQAKPSQDRIDRAVR